MKIKFAALLLTAFFVSGCVNTSMVEYHQPQAGEKSRSGKTVVSHLEVFNTGVYLFNRFPVWSGSVYYPNVRRYRLFEDQINEWGLRRLMDTGVRMCGAESVEDVEFTSDATGAFTLWIFWRRTVRGHGIAVKNPPVKKKTVTEINK